ncbi:MULTISPECIES: response regulator receiver domain [Bacillus]|uniref:response regulator receiver domain n=1 Tax=Bacillus TaxID=1386 RepID=UPI000BA473F0|nr:MULTISPECIES: response regulator receiver domain [Bacillus]AYV16881.1 hypothetical protein EEB07_05400 [Bacillus velezensis]MCY1637709.1 response regulator receiver domain [Bacillus sp. SL112]MEC2019378.1 response regulator receiver domain [Bacillus velezensis]PAB04843.1 hypothetical protein BHU79_06975 [Bacillus velezensis]QMT20178.1 hypothetical protein H2N74_15370 [Bacillus velezensis]
MNDGFLTEVKRIVRGYFNSAVVVDDELFNNQTDNLTELSDKDLGISEGELGFNGGGTQTAEKQMIETPYNAKSVYEDLLNIGIVTVPWQYSSSDDLEKLEPILMNTKMLIVDWKLIESRDPYIMGDDSLILINKLVSHNRGLKCAVIYTQENLDVVKEKVETKYSVTDIKDILDSKSYENNCLYFEEENSETNSLFGFIIDKQTQPSKIIDYIAEVLLKDKSIALHLMDSSMHLNSNIDKAINIFNTPYEKVLFTQAMTSDLSKKKISNIINETFLTSILQMELQEDFENTNDFLFETKKQEIIQNLQYLDIQKFGVFKELFAFKDSNISFIKDLLLKEEFKSDIVTSLLQASSMASLKEHIHQTFKGYLKGANEKNQKKIINDFYLILLFLDYCNQNKQLTHQEFKAGFYEQTYHFTKILKYVQPEDRITTGSIIQEEGFLNRFLLCITPLCDTVRPDEINHKFKFLIGEKVTEYSSKHLKNNSKKHYYLTVPINGEISVIRWDFFHVKTINLKSVPTYKPVINLKKEYIQNIMNLYTAYQAKAGVDELFFKESNYIDNFFNIIKGRAN